MIADWRLSEVVISMMTPVFWVMYGNEAGERGRIPIHIHLHGYMTSARCRCICNFYFIRYTGVPVVPDPCAAEHYSMGKWMMVAARRFYAGPTYKEVGEYLCWIRWHTTSPQDCRSQNERIIKEPSNDREGQAHSDS